MSLVQHISDRLNALGVTCSPEEGDVVIHAGQAVSRIHIDDGWAEAFDHYRRARSISFDVDTRVLVHNNSVELLLVRLDPGYFSSGQYSFRDAKGNSVSVSSASEAFSLAFFDSPEYENYFKTRILRRLDNVRLRRVSQLMWIPTTACYTAKGRKTPSNLREVAHQRIKSCLLKIAVEQHDCFSVWKQKAKRLKPLYLRTPGEDFSIPRATYDENVVSYYKVAKASPFPSQSFLAYYHVLEYYFLKVSEDLLHHRLTAMLNDTRFRPGHDSLDKLIALVRGQDARSDETEMLRNVLDRFVPETDLISFIGQFEDDCGEKVYSKKRKVFGEQIEIVLRDGHALSNAAKALKHVRNAIVHSSDRYKREECHVPLSESEELIEEFIPLARFFAEKVIYGTAT